MKHESSRCAPQSSARKRLHAGGTVFYTRLGFKSHPARAAERGAFLSWMQEKKAPVFVVATANDVSQLPPEPLRKGRWWDELFFVDLPNLEEREQIWRIQIEKWGRSLSAYHIVQLARATEGWTGSEIEAVFCEALYLAFDEGGEPIDLTIARAMVDFVPLSKLMKEQMEDMRRWVVGRARPASLVC